MIRNESAASGVATLTPLGIRAVDASGHAGAKRVVRVDPDDPIVFDTDLLHQVRLADGTRLDVRLDDLCTLPAPSGPGSGARAVAWLGDEPVAVVVGGPDGGRLLVGSSSLFDPRTHARADNARLAAALGIADAGAPSVPTAAPDLPVLDLAADPGWAALRGALPPGLTVHDPALVRAAGHARRLLPAPLHDALVDLADECPPGGGLLVRGVPIGDLPPTPPTPTTPTGKDAWTELVLLAVARRLGQPVGYEPEHGGGLVQNLVPVPGTEGHQVSTSSDVLLEFHTETAFHRHRPRYLVLLCLRGDPGAATLLSSISWALDALTSGQRTVLSEPRFRLGVDESFAGGRTDRLGRRRAVLTGHPDTPDLTFDADLMVADDPEAAEALDVLRHTLAERARPVVLEAGDLLVVDNHRAVHGRSAFRARYDGTDRWLQRTFVVADLLPSAAERTGRVITTRYAG